MSIHARTSSIWREIHNPQMRTSSVWRTCRGMWAQTSSVWRNVRPTTRSSVTIGNGYGGKLYEYGYSAGTTASGTAAYTPAAFGTLGAPTYFGDQLIIRASWLGATVTVRLGTASLGSSFVGGVQVGTYTCTSLTYSTGTGYSQWTGTLSGTPATAGSIDVYVRGP